MKRICRIICTVLLILSISIGTMACKDTSATVADATSAHSTTTTSASVTTSPWVGNYEEYGDLESPYHLFYRESYNCHGLKFDKLPDGYTHPDGTHSFYIDHSVYLPEDFYRPDLIWGEEIIWIGVPPIPNHGELYNERFAYDRAYYSFAFDTNYPDAKYAIAIEKGSDEFNQAFKNGVIQLDWEFVCDREKEMIFAATLDQIVWLGTNFDDFQKQAGYVFERVVFSAGKSNYDDLYHTEDCPE